jgi:2-dehydropantoate 2-reductase
MKKTRILIAGIGGVGGYFGGLLAKHFYENNEIEIIFYARGKHLLEIQKNGLKVTKGDNDFFAIPKLATDNPKEIGIVDFIIICTKSYDIETTIEQLKVCLNKDTIILPLQNGVDSKERIRNTLPNNIILDGCVYIVSRLTDFGKIEIFGNIETLYFGMENLENEKLNFLETIFKQADINATLSKNISSIIWEKFIFISPTATATTYYDSTIGELLTDSNKLEIIVQLIEEVKQIAKVKNIIVSDDITNLTLKKLKNLPFETTSSMNTDFKNNKTNTELKSLTEYIVTEGKKHKIKTLTFEKLLTELKKNGS